MCVKDASPLGFKTQKTPKSSDITLLRSITVLCGIDIIMWNIPHIQSA